MDKIPKLRRKPKPPTIETTVDRTSTDTSESALSTSNNYNTVAETQSPSGARRQHSSEWFKSKTSSSSSASRKKSPFRLIRPSAKRAREDSPAADSSSAAGGSPQQRLQVAGQGGAKFPRNGAGGGGSSRPSTLAADDEETSSVDGVAVFADPGPQMPGFLKLTNQEMDSKLNELNWDERIRASVAQSGPHPEGSSEWRWGTFKQTDVPEKGLMDRYVNIKPWNHNRVRLHVPPGQLDYVNASTIRLQSPSDRSRPPLSYIAMQGPTEPSIPYVWRMISEQVQSPAVIVQLTNNIESGNLKCNAYFPDADDVGPWPVNEDDVWEDDWQATLSFESMEPLYDGIIEKTRLRLQVEGKEPITVWHFLYTRWPDFGVPPLDEMDSFFELMRLSREHSSPAGPRVIHCSAGVGRTGTFICLEHLIRELDVGGLSDPPSNGHARVEPKDAQDPVFNTVDMLRQQRRGMVQGETQYRFIYSVMKKLWEDKHNPPRLPRIRQPAATDDEDEDMAEGGASIQRTRDPTPNDVDSDPFYDSNSPARRAGNNNSKSNNTNDDDDDDDDEDDGGARVRPDGPSDGK